MRTAVSISIVLSMSLATAAAAAEFDGSVPLVCTVTQASNCLPKAACTPVKAESSITPVYTLDFAAKTIHSPFRTKNPLKVQHQTTNSDSVVLQGTDLLFAWSAMVDKKTGALTVSIADSTGAYVAFGQCKAVAAK